MKKTILLATFCVAGMVSVSAKETETNKEKEAVSKTEQSESSQKVAMTCQQVGLYVWCKDTTYEDTICWGEGSHNSTHQQAHIEEIHNAQLLTEFLCGKQNP